MKAYRVIRHIPSLILDIVVLLEVSDQLYVPPALPPVKGKGKAVPLEALSGPEGSRRLRLPDFKTIGL